MSTQEKGNDNHLQMIWRCTQLLKNITGQLTEKMNLAMELHWENVNDMGYSHWVQTIYSIV